MHSISSRSDAHASSAVAPSAATTWKAPSKRSASAVQLSTISSRRAVAAPHVVLPVLQRRAPARPLERAAIGRLEGHAVAAVLVGGRRANAMCRWCTRSAVDRQCLLPVTWLGTRWLSLWTPGRAVAACASIRSLLRKWRPATNSPAQISPSTTNVERSATSWDELVDHDNEHAAQGGPDRHHPPGEEAVGAVDPPEQPRRDDRLAEADGDHVPEHADHRHQTEQHGGHDPVAAERVHDREHRAAGERDRQARARIRGASTGTTRSCRRRSRRAPCRCRGGRTSASRCAAPPAQRARARPTSRWTPGSRGRGSPPSGTAPRGRAASAGRRGARCARAPAHCRRSPPGTCLGS